MDQFDDVIQQVEALSQKLQEVVQTRQNTDMEIVMRTNALDTQLQDYAQNLREKRQPTIRTF